MLTSVMEFFLGLLAFALLFGPWIAFLVLRHSLREQVRSVEQRLGGITQRLHELESAVRKPGTPEHTEAAPKRPAPASPTTAAVDESRNVEPAIASRVAGKITPPEPVELPPIPPVRRPVVIPALPGITPSTPIGVREETATVVDEPKGAGLEEMLGKNWLNKLGIILLVVGVAFFLAYQLQNLGPAGKVLVGYTVSLTLLVAGVWFERNDRYRILARAGIGGGWALLFFTTYALYHVPAAQVLTSQLLDLVLMLVVALAMVAHTLHYNSQVVTGLAFLLAYLTIFVSRVSVYSLAAGVVLALGMAIIAVRKSWFELEVFGILASYFNHFFWLRTIIEPMGDQRQQFPEFLPSAAILVSYWLIYRASYLARRVENATQESISTISALLNSILLMGLLKYQSLHPEWAFWALLALGTTELAIGQLPITRRRRMAFAVLSTLGAVLLVAAIPFRYSGAHVSVLWMMEAEAFFLAGLGSAEVVFTRLGLLAGLATAGHMMIVDAGGVFRQRWDGVNVAADYRVGLLVLGVGAIVLCANVHWFSRTWKQQFDNDFDRYLLAVTSYAAALLAATALWMAFPEEWTAVTWSTLALLLAVVARRFEWQDFAVQANVICAAALVRVLVVNLNSTASFHGVSLRLVSVGTVAGLYYLTAHWTGFTNRTVATPLSVAYTGTASALVATLIWYEADPLYIALLWCLFGVVLFQTGLGSRNASLRWQAYGAVAAAFMRMLLYNLADGPQPAHFTARIYSVVPIAVACFYFFFRRQAIESDNERPIATAQAWMGTLTVVALAWYLTELDWLVTSWAGITFLLLAVAWVLRIATFTQQGVILSLAVLLCAVLENMDNFTPGWGDRSIAVGVASAVLFLSLFFCFRLRKVKIAGEQGRTDFKLGSLFDRPQQTLFFAPLLMVTFLLAQEMRSGLLTVSWGIEAVAVFLFALVVNERSYRLSGLGLLLLCVGKIVVVDVWGLNPRDRYITFIIMGCALLLVSFLYTRYRDAIKQYL